MTFDRKAHWQGIYRDRSPLDVSWFQTTPSLSLELIDACGLDREAAIIDVGGGASRLADHLLDAGYTNLSVLDISDNALAHTRRRLGPRAGAVRWIAADVTEFTPPARYDLWHDRAVFHFLTDPADRRRYVERLETALVDGGHAIVAAFAIGGPTQCSGLDIVQYDADTLAAALGGGFTLIDARAERHITPASKVQQFGYFRFVRR